MLNKIIKELEDLRKIDLLDKSSNEKLLTRLEEIRYFIVYSGFLDIEEDFIFNPNDKFKRDCYCKEDIISRITTSYNKTRAYLFSQAVEIIKESKKQENTENRSYYVEKIINKLPGKINHKNSYTAFRYFNDTNLKELAEVIIPEISDKENEKGDLTTRYLFLYLHKILSAYLFINFSRFVINTDINYFILRDSINMYRMKELIHSTYKTYNGTSLDDFKRTIRQFILKVSNFVNSKSEQNLLSLVHRYGDSKYLLKVTSVFVNNNFREFITNNYSSYSYSSYFGTGTEDIDFYVKNKFGELMEKLFNILKH